MRDRFLKQASREYSPRRRLAALTVVLIGLLCSGLAPPVAPRTLRDVGPPRHEGLIQAASVPGSGLDFLAQATGAITGVVNDAGGSAAPHILVTASTYATAIQCESSSGGASETDDQGRYRIDLAPGAYLVYVNSHGGPTRYLPQAYPDVGSWRRIAEAIAVSVVAGQTTPGINFSLATGCTLTGRLVDAAGQPVRGAGGHIENLTQTVEYGCQLGFGSSDADGTFRVNVPAGIYDLFFGLPGEGHTVRYGLEVRDNLDLGDVLFAEGPRPSGPRALEPGYSAAWFVAPGPFHMPQEIMRTPSGDLWVLAVRTQTLYRLARDGSVTTVATNVDAYQADMDAAGVAYLHGQPVGAIYRVAPDGTKTIVAQSSELRSACDSGFGIGPDGNLYVALDRCAGISELIRITPAWVITHLKDGLPPLNGLHTAPDGRFLAAGNNRLYALSLADYTLTLLAQIPTCCISPGGLTTDEAGNAYLATNARQPSGHLYRVVPDGSATLLAQIPRSGLSGLDWLPDTQEVVGGQLRQGNVLAVSRAGAIRQIAAGNGLITPMGMAFALDGDLAVACDDGGMMARVTRQGEAKWFFDYTSFTPPMPFVAYVADGTLYASEGAPGFTGQIISLPPGAVTPGRYVYADWPSGLALDRTGALLVSETLAGRIVRINPDRTAAVIAAGLTLPQGLALDAAGQIYAVTGKGNAQLNETFPVPSMGDTIVRIGPAGQAVTVTQLMDAAAIAFTPGGDLFAAAGRRVYRIAADGSTSPFADGFDQAMGLAFDLVGDLYVADAWQNGIARITGFPQGAIAGRVTDARTGRPIPAASLAVVTGLPVVLGTQLVADADGRYGLPAAPRAYTVTATGAGHCPASAAVTVTAGLTAALDLRLLPCGQYLPLVLRPR